MMDPENTGAKKTMQVLTGSALLGAFLHALHCFKLVGGYVSQCDCHSATDFVSFAYNLDEVVIAGLLFNTEILVGLCAATAVGILTLTRSAFIQK